METASSKTETTSYPATSAGARRAGMTEEQWRAAIKFDGNDVGWVIMSIGMAIGAGICFFTCTGWLNGIVGFLTFLRDWLPRNVPFPTPIY